MIRNLDKFVPGAVFLKGSNGIQAKWAKYAKDHGHRVVAIDEEVTAMVDKRFILQGVTSEFLGTLDRFFVQGENQHRIFVEEFPQHQKRLRVTGNPRFDLLAPVMTKSFQAHVESIRKRFGRYILVNTNFGAGNTGLGSREKFVEMCERVGYAYWENPDDRKWFEATFDFEENNMEHFQELVRALRDRFPTHQIVLRPHPAEDHSVWKRSLAEEDRIHIVFEGAAVPWMLGADFMIHNTCTTGTEAMVLGIPVAAYSPYTNWKESIFLSNLVTPVFRELTTLFEAVQSAIENRVRAVAEIQAVFAERLSVHISLAGECGATNAIMAALEDLDLQSTEGSLFRGGDNNLTLVALDEYRKRKMNLTRDDLIKNMENIARGLGIVARVRVSDVTKSMFAVYDAQDK